MGKKRVDRLREMCQPRSNSLSPGFPIKTMHNSNLPNFLYKVFDELVSHHGVVLVLGLSTLHSDLPPEYKVSTLSALVGVNGSLQMVRHAAGTSEPLVGSSDRPLPLSQTNEWTDNAQNAAVGPGGLPQVANEGHSTINELNTDDSPPPFSKDPWF